MWVRAYLRLVGCFTVLAVLFPIRLSAKILRPFLPAFEQRCRRALFQWCCRGLLASSGIRVRVEGRAPEAPYFLVSNHLSFFDIWLLASQLGCVFVSRGDLAHWPLLGYVAREMNTIFIDRERLKDTVRVNQLLAEVMKEGYGVAIFPESGVSQKGTVLPFKPALLESAVQAKLPVHYAIVRYTTPEGCPPASEVSVWKEGVSFFRHFINVASLPHSVATLTFGEVPILGDDRKVLAAELCEAVRARFTPLD